jgi:hypothetical protein
MRYAGIGYFGTRARAGAVVVEGIIRIFSVAALPQKAIRTCPHGAFEYNHHKS